MKIEAGKFYKTRDGFKVEIYSTDNGGAYPAHGRKFYPDNNASDCWMQDGRAWVSISPNDLVSEWREPVIDWAKYPKWIKAVAMDDGCCCYGFSSVPFAINGIWDVDYPEACRAVRGDLMPNYPAGTNWKDSLLIRPDHD